MLSMQPPAGAARVAVTPQTPFVPRVTTYARAAQPAVDMRIVLPTTSTFVPQVRAAGATFAGAQPDVERSQTRNPYDVTTAATVVDRATAAPGFKLCSETILRVKAHLPFDPRRYSVANVRNSSGSVLSGCQVELISSSPANA